MVNSLLNFINIKLYVIITETNPSAVAVEEDTYTTEIVVGVLVGVLVLVIAVVVIVVFIRLVNSPGFL